MFARFSCALSFLCLSISSWAQGSHVLNIVKDIQAGRTRVWRCNTEVVGQTRARVNFTTVSPYPTLTVNRSAPSDWSNFDAFLIDVENVESFPVLFYLRLDNSVNADGVNNCRSGWAYISPGQRRTFAFPLRLDPAAFGMRGMPGLDGATWFSMNNSVLQINHVVRYLIYLANPSQNQSIIVGSPRLLRSAGNFNNLVDQFGQYTRAEWPGKIHSQAEIINQDIAELADLSSRPALENRTTYGSWNGGVNLTSSGRFRTQKVGFNWWMVAPDGFPFLSFGINATGDSDPTIYTGREYMFEWMPEPEDPLYEHFSPIQEILPNYSGDTQTYNFKEANIMRKFGANWRPLRDERALTRMISWGFNTLGDWSRETLWAQQRVPYTVGCEWPKNHTTILVDPKRIGMSDPFDPTFRTDVQNAAVLNAERAADDPWCVGWFMDNEPNFIGGVEESGRYGVARAVMARSIFDCPSKAVFLADLQAKYQDVGMLNAAWGTNFANWSVMAFPVTIPDSNGTAARKEDFRLFCLKFAREYFRILDEELHLADDRAMFLGSRFFRHSPEVLAAAEQYCDVISFNIYATQLPAVWSTYQNFTKPFMVSEFHFGSLDRGLFHPGLVPASTTQQRADFFTQYVESVINNPQFVGCHWHQYSDQPVTGRVVNGENYNIGFVSVADVPYPELVTAARDIFKRGYEVRWEGN